MAILREESHHARQNNCHVISMSVGGVAGSTLHNAVRNAVNADIIVCAAARNCVGANPGAVSQGEGTSFAVAGIAGIAALWLAHHGRAALLARYNGQARLQDVFGHVLRITDRDIGLPPNEFGAGLVDAEAVLKCPLPKPAELAPRVAASRRTSTVDVIRGAVEWRSATPGVLVQDNWLARVVRLDPHEPHRDRAFAHLQLRERRP